MRKIILLVVLAIFLMGCENSMKGARARDIRARTNRANEIHDLAMADRAALTPARLAAKENLLWAGTIGGMVLIVVTACSVSYYIAGFVVVKVRQDNLMLVPLDRHTRQYPAIIYSGNRMSNPNTLSNSDLRLDSLPYPELVNGSHMVQLSGVRFNSYEDYQEQKLLGDGD